MGLFDFADLAGSFIRDDLAVRKYYLAIGLGSQRSVVRDQDEGDVILAVELFHQFEYMLAVTRIEIARRLIRKQYLWAVGESSGDGDTLLFAA